MQRLLNRPSSERDQSRLASREKTQVWPVHTPVSSSGDDLSYLSMSFPKRYHFLWWVMKLLKTRTTSLETILNGPVGNKETGRTVATIALLPQYRRSDACPIAEHERLARSRSFVSPSAGRYHFPLLVARDEAKWITCLAIPFDQGYYSMLTVKTR